VQDLVDNAFNVSAMQAKYASLEVSGYTFLSSSSDFQAAINQLNSHVSARAAAVSSFLNK